MIGPVLKPSNNSGPPPGSRLDANSINKYRHSILEPLHDSSCLFMVNFPIKFGPQTSTSADHIGSFKSYPSPTFYEPNARVLSFSRSASPKPALHSPPRLRLPVPLRGTHYSFCPEDLIYPSTRRIQINP